MREELKRAFEELKMLTRQFYETSLDETIINSIDNLDNMKVRTLRLQIKEAIIRLSIFTAPD
jgi:hypothetical protein